MTTKSLNPSLPPIEFAVAQHYGAHASTLTANTALKYGVVALAVGLVALSFNQVRITKLIEHIAPIVVRVNEVGNAQAIAYSRVAYMPQAPEVRYFLAHFVTGYYGRNHRTLQQTYGDSLFFLARPLWETISTRDQKTQWMAKFLVGSEDDIDVTVNNVVIEQLEKEPYQARVEFTKVFTASGGSETKRENWAAEFFFVINRDIPATLVNKNPLGISLVSFREDQAFN